MITYDNMPTCKGEWMNDCPYPECACAKKLLPIINVPMQTKYLIIINQHPSITDVRLVEKSKWPEENNFWGYHDNTTPVFDDSRYERQKLSALQSGAVVFLTDLNKLKLLPLDSWDENDKTKAGVYELDPAKWNVEIRWQYFTKVDKHWNYCDENIFSLESAIKYQCETRQIALISPIETPKEDEQPEMARGDRRVMAAASTISFLSDFIHGLEAGLVDDKLNMHLLNARDCFERLNIRDHRKLDSVR